MLLRLYLLISFLLLFSFSNANSQVKGSKVEIYTQDFFQADISDADIIYLFLVEHAVTKVWQKIKAETKPGTIVIVLSNIIPSEDYYDRLKTRPDKGNSSYYYLYRV